MEEGGIFMSLNKWFEKGLEKEAYMARLDHHKESFQHIYNTFEVPEEDKEKFKAIDGVRAIVLAAEWCGHCMMDIPIYLNIAETADIDTRFLIRDDNLELMDQYLTNEKRYIPIFIFIDKDGNEIGKWGPWAPEINEFTNELKKDLPDRESEEYDEAFKQFVKRVSKAFSTDEKLWGYVYNDMKKTILNLN